SALAPFCEHHPKKQKGRASGQGGSKAWKERREKKGALKRTGGDGSKGEKEGVRERDEGGEGLAEGRSEMDVLKRRVDDGCKGGKEVGREEGGEGEKDEKRDRKRSEREENGALHSEGEEGEKKEGLKGKRTEAMVVAIESTRNVERNGAELEKEEGVEGKRAAVVVAGRTDKGVHAAGQVCAFHTWKNPLDLTAVAAAADADMCYQPSPFSPLIPSPPLPVLTPPLQSDTWKDPLDLTAVAAAVDAVTKGSLRVISISKSLLSPPSPLTCKSLAPSTHNFQSAGAVISSFETSLAPSTRNSQPAGAATSTCCRFCCSGSDAHQTAQPNTSAHHLPLPFPSCPSGPALLPPAILSPLAPLPLCAAIAAVGGVRLRNPEHEKDLSGAVDDGAFESTQSHVKKACVAVQDLSGAVADGGGAAGDSAAGGAAAGDGADGGGATGDSAAAVDGGNGAGAGAGAGAVYSIKEDANGKTTIPCHIPLHALETHTRAHGPTCFRAFVRDTAAGRGRPMHALETHACSGDPCMLLRPMHAPMALPVSEHLPETLLLAEAGERGQVRRTGEEGSGSATVCNLWRARALEANLPVAAEKAGEPEGALAEGRAMCVPTGEAGAAGTAGVASAAGGAGMRVLCVELMVRVLVATAVREAAAGGGDTCLLRLAATGERRSTAPPAPAAGLCLVDVGYSDILPLPLGC
ncbi:unnamed protein product, partial [Closterium sp. Naga37s-1]